MPLQGALLPVVAWIHPSTLELLLQLPAEIE
jgi:hypothetical protein